MGRRPAGAWWIFSLGLLFAAPAAGADLHDAARSGVTAEKLAVALAVAARCLSVWPSYPASTAISLLKKGAAAGLSSSAAARIPARTLLGKPAAAANGPLAHFLA
jgi:hypothetical protein